MIRERLIVGKHKETVGLDPAVILINPKYPHNIGSIIRAASCFGFKQVWYTGNRVPMDTSMRLPREERMKGYADVDLYQFDYPFDCFADNIIPVAVEIVPNSESLIDFEHPEKAVYVFGPEDGSIPQVIKRFCHRFVTIPTKHCVNLSSAGYLIMYDRMVKRVRDGLDNPPELVEDRGWWSPGEWGK